MTCPSESGPGRILGCEHNPGWKEICNRQKEKEHGHSGISVDKPGLSGILNVMPPGYYRLQTNRPE